MAMNPSVQEKAQADIDRVAPNRLPTLDDYDSLPYIRAIIKEVMRWAPVAPLGFFCIDDPLFSTWHLNSSSITPPGDGRWRIRQLLHQKGNQGYCEYLVCPPLIFFAHPFLLSTRGMTHDEEIYPDPFTFNPNRHLGDDAQPDPYKFAFGFGRRVCPGVFSLGE